MQLEVKKYDLPSVIEFNFDELKNELEAKTEHYGTLVYTGSEIKSAKKDRANLNNFKKALNDERIRLEREYMAPFKEFKAKIDELIDIVDKPCKAIDTQIKEYEAEQKRQKAEKIEAIWAGIEKPDFVKLENFSNPKWENVTYSIEDIEQELKFAIQKVYTDISTLANLPEFSFEATEEYKSTLDIYKTLNEANKLSERAKLKAEMEHKEPPKTEPTENFMNAPVEEEIKPIEEVVVNRQWVSFQAYMTVDEAKELKAFCKQKGIELKR